jgi:N-acetylneuraminate synthase
MKHQIFEDLFVLELANNHWGKLERGLEMVTQYSRIVRFNNVRAAIKLQFRDVDSFIHKDWKDRTDIRYIRKTLETQLSKDQYKTFVKAIKDGGCIPMTTPFDEKSVDLAVELGIDILKIASYDINDWFLIEKIASTRKPVICSTGGSSLKDMDDLITFFRNRQIPLALNHCVSAYPSEDEELELNQIDFLRNRYPDITIGFSTHEYHNWEWSIMMAYAKGARTFERHIDIDDGLMTVPAYNSLPHQVDVWFKAFKKAQEMCGAPGTQKRKPLEREIKYLDKLVRGVYAKRDLPKGTALTTSDVYLAVPLQQGQISCRELMSGEVLQKDIKADAPIHIDEIDSPYAKNESLKALIYKRGLDPKMPKGPDFNHGDQCIPNISTVKAVKSPVAKNENC